jgi:hypothetical protein
MSTTTGTRTVGTGLTVYEDEQLVEGPTVWLDSPQAVMAFVRDGDPASTIVIARGGTTTFLTPALTAGVKGVITLQGAPESHLGILSREYGIPCVMSAAFTEGTRSARGEVIPPDGSIVQLDVRSTPEGHVLIPEGASLGAPADEPTPESASAADEAAQIQHLIRFYGGEVPHGSEGDRQMRAKQATDALVLSDESLARDLTTPEANDLLTYFGWNFWDILSARVTEGESGLIPRQEYEALGIMEHWMRNVRAQRVIQEAVGADGLREIGALARHEVGTKVNLLHIWAAGMGTSFGRGIALGLGLHAPHVGWDDMKFSLQFQRHLFRGMWDDQGPMFTSNRGYELPILDQDLLDRFADERHAIADGEQRRLFQKFSATTELLGFLLHFDSRLGLGDSGPYPVPGGGWMVVRDHFLNDPHLHWSDVSDDLPHAITQAMFFKDDPGMKVSLVDNGTLWTQPANYLKNLVGVAVYARDRWDTPISELRLLDEAEMNTILARSDRAAQALYRRIAAMSRRDKIEAGIHVYCADFVVPFARAAGVWDQLVADGYLEVDQRTANAYYPMVVEGQAAELIPRLFITGGGFQPLPDGAPDDSQGSQPVAVSDAAREAYPRLHALALRGVLADVPDGEALEAADLVVRTKAGWMLSDTGRVVHEQLLSEERVALDTGAMRTAYSRFLSANGPFKALTARWQTADDDARFELLGQVEDLVERIRPALRRTSETLPRFGGYDQRLRDAVETAAEDPDYVAGARVDSVHTVWMELHEDYLQTLDIDREDEGSF